VQLFGKRLDMVEKFGVIECRPGVEDPAPWALSHEPRDLHHSLVSTEAVPSRQLLPASEAFQYLFSAELLQNEAALLSHEVVLASRAGSATGG
jgi:hypothetical protein